MYPSSLAVRAKGKTGHYLHTLSCGDSFVCLLGIVMFCLLLGTLPFWPSSPVTSTFCLSCCSLYSSSEKPLLSVSLLYTENGGWPTQSTLFFILSSIFRSDVLRSIFFEHLVCHIPGYKRCHFKYVFIVAPGGYIAIFPSPA